MSAVSQEMYFVFGGYNCRICLTGGRKWKSKKSHSTNYTFMGHFDDAISVNKCLTTGNLSKHLHLLTIVTPVFDLQENPDCIW